MKERDRSKRYANSPKLKKGRLQSKGESKRQAAERDDPARRQRRGARAS
jgi:hypothetical protein